MKNKAGFTLVELLVVLAIVAIMLPAGYQLLGMSAQAKTTVEDHVQKHDELFNLIDLLQNDIEMSLDRNVRSELGEVEASLIVQGSSLSLTRAGWSNPTQQERSQMQRVQYELVDGALVRRFWSVLDRDIDSTSKETVFESVHSFGANVLTKSGWIANWPNNSYLAGDATNNEGPAAIMVKIETKEGALSRVFEIPRISALEVDK